MIDDDLIIAGQSVIVDGTINGDLAVAGSKIIINGTVTGSVMAAGQSLTGNRCRSTAKWAAHSTALVPACNYGSGIGCASFK